MTNHDDLHRDLGRMEAGLEALKDIVREGFKGSNERLDKLETRMAALEAKETERKGVWKTIVAISGLVSAAVAGLVKYLLT
jgi:hypothetical protein